MHGLRATAPPLRSIGPSVLLASSIALSACGGPQAASPSPSAGSASSPGAQASARPSPTPTAEQRAVAAFVDRVTSGAFRYRMSYAGRLALSISSASIKGHTDVVGEDFASDVRYTGTSNDVRGLAIRIRIRAVDGTGYADAGDGWKTLKAWRDDDTNVPFHGVSSERDVRVVATEKRNGATVYRVSVPDAHLIDPTSVPGRLTNERIRSVKLELVIDEKGKPLDGTWKLDGQARVGASSQLQQILFELDLTFSKVDGKVTVSKP